MCHVPVFDPQFFRFLTYIDDTVAAEVQAAGCPYCVGAMHRANYPRKPRGRAIHQAWLGVPRQDVGGVQVFTHSVTRAAGIGRAIP